MGSGPHNSTDRLIFFAWLLGAESQSIIYSSGPGQSENYTRKLLIHAKTTDSSRAVSVSEDIIRQRLLLSEFAKECVHKDFLLAESVKEGVAFHYGRIPSPLRRAIEDGFLRGILTHIVSTSTLLQGVNLPARNIFMLDPTKGEEEPLTVTEFWNLAGRAGRLGKEFQGNVFLVDYEKWRSSPLEKEKQQTIEPALESIIRDRRQDFINFLKDEDVPTSNSSYEAAFCKLIEDERHGRIHASLDALHSLEPTFRDELAEAIRNASEKIDVNVETLEASPRISGYRQQELLNYFKLKIREKGAPYLMPAHPSSDWDGALNKMRPVFARVHKYLEKKSGKTHLYWAPLALRWMRGTSLPEIIEDTISYHKRQGQKRASGTVIREVLLNIEQHLRFRYVNLLGCYTEVLRLALREEGFKKETERIPPLQLFLKLGASSNTMVQLIGAGFSRHSASIISRNVTNKNLDQYGTRLLVR